MKESEIEKLLMSEVKKLGGRAYKWISPGNDGVPDRIVFLPDYPPVFVELKTDKGKLSPIQTVQIKRLTALGQQVEVTYGISGIIRLFERCGEPETATRLRQKYKVGDWDDF
ncbi:MAG: VRR-NUC domain-containing protein [Lachnospiraceae bacterium]